MVKMKDVCLLRFFPKYFLSVALFLIFFFKNLKIVLLLPGRVGNGALGANQGPAQLTDLQGIFSNVISLAIGAAGIVFFILFVVGGFSYLTAGGDEKKVEGAKKILTYAIGGLVLIALSYLILRLIATFTGVTGILNFQIYQP